MVSFHSNLVISSDPPVIDRNIALPTQPTIITGGAGRPDITTGSGSNVRLYCPSTGRPAATIAWQRRVGGNLVAVNPSFVSTTMVGGIPTALLTLNNVQAADFTEYVCTATNVVGNDTQSVTLVAAGKLLVLLHGALSLSSLQVLRLTLTRPLPHQVLLLQLMKTI